MKFSLPNRFGNLIYKKSTKSEAKSIRLHALWQKIPLKRDKIEKSLPVLPQFFKHIFKEFSML